MKKQYQNPQTGEIIEWNGSTWVPVPPETIQARQEAVVPTTPMARIGRGLMDVAQGGKQRTLQLQDTFSGGTAAQDYTQQVDQDLAMYEKGRAKEGSEGFDWMRFGGNVAGTLPASLYSPAKLQSLPGRMTVSGGQGLLGASMLYTPEKSSLLGQQILGLAAGGAAPLATQLIGKAGAGVVSRLGNAFNRIAQHPSTVKANIGKAIQPYLDEVGMKFDELPETLQDNLTLAAKEQLKVAGKLDPAALARKAQAESLGFVGDSALTTGQVTRSPKQWARERNLAKIEGAGDDLQGRFANQNNRFLAVQDELTSQIKSQAETPYEAGRSMVNSVMEKWKSTQDEVGKLYREIGEKNGWLRAVDLDGMLKKLDDLSDDATADQITNSVSRRAKRFGLVDDNGFTGKPLSIEEAESFRKFIGKLSDGGDPNLMRVKREIIDSLDDSVIDSIGDDAYSVARNKARERFAEFGEDTLGKITKGKLRPDDAFSRGVLKAPLADLSATKKSLLTPVKEGQPPAGLQAWEDIRKQTIDWLWDKATAGHGKEGTFSGAAFEKALKQLGREKLAVLFSPKERGKLFATGKTGIDVTYTPPYAPVNWSGTAPEIYNLMQRSKWLPGIGDAISGAGKRGAEKAEVTASLAGAPIDLGLIKGGQKALTDRISRGLLTTNPGHMSGLLAPQVLDYLFGSNNQ